MPKQQKQDKSKTRVYAPGPHVTLPLGSGMAEDAKRKLRRRGRDIDATVDKAAGKKKR